MKVETIVVGLLKENTYLLSIDNKVLIIDPGDEYPKIKEHLEGKEVVAILITHKHFDHIGALSFFENIPVYSFSNLKEKKYTIGPFTFEVIFNPGHSNDSVSFYFAKNKLLFSGDFLFFENVGRCDLPTGNSSKMIESIQKIKKYPLDTKIYPGHGTHTTMKHELDNNPYFN